MPDQGPGAWGGSSGPPWVCACRRSVPAAVPEPEVDEAPVPDLLGSILSGQSLLMMNSADIVIHRDGSLSARRAGEAPSAPAVPCTPGSRNNRGTQRVGEPPH